MKLTKTQHKKLEQLIPLARKPAKISNYKFIIENCCKQINLPKKHEKWHTIYMKFNRWYKNGRIAGAIAFFL